MINISYFLRFCHRKKLFFHWLLYPCMELLLDFINGSPKCDTTCRWCEKNGGEKYVQLTVRCRVLSANAIKMFTSFPVLHCIFQSSLSASLQVEFGTPWNKMLGKQSLLSFLEGMWDFWKLINGGRWNLSFSGAEFKIHQTEKQLFIAINKDMQLCCSGGRNPPLRLIAADHQGARVSIGGISIHVSLISHCSAFMSDCFSDVNRFGEAALFLLYLISISRNCLSPRVLLLAAGPERGNLKCNLPDLVWLLSCTAGIELHTNDPWPWAHLSEEGQITHN